MINFPSLIYKDLKEFALSCKMELIVEEPYDFVYPIELLNYTDEKVWEECIPIIKEFNIDILSKLRNNANLYTIYIRRSKNDKWMPMYVGERKSDGMRERITQHLINKNAATGSKLAEVKEVIRSGGSIGVSFIKVEPESLRLYVEENIINNSSADILIWNKQGKNNTI
ncbi:hypothetical protein [Bacillus tuaregi]|uniref:hypothetical protein n=1 Tax=Bacillus tuaregi TaxID=1816695 RepID=UPI0008F884B0|nr:hypothetical protein [Bacillus tuaregi]